MSADDSQWEKEQEKFELTLKYIEGDRENFLVKAEEAIANIGNRINQLEKEAMNAADDVKDEMAARMDDLVSFKKELEQRMEDVKNNTTDAWNNAKNWLIEKSKSIKDYITAN